MLWKELEEGDVVQPVGSLSMPWLVLKKNNNTIICLELDTGIMTTDDVIFYELDLPFASDVKVYRGRENINI